MKKILLLLIPVLFLLNSCIFYDEPEPLAIYDGTFEEKIISDELAHNAYDNIFILSWATLDAPTDSIQIETNGKNKTFTFNNLNYRPDEFPNALVNGYITTITGEEIDKVIAYYVFTNDPFGVEIIGMQSSGPHGNSSHTDGTILINGAEKPVEEFVNYIKNKLN